MPARCGRKCRATYDGQGLLPHPPNNRATVVWIQQHLDTIVRDSLRWRDFHIPDAHLIKVSFQKGGAPVGEDDIRDHSTSGSDISEDISQHHSSDDDISEDATSDDDFSEDVISEDDISVDATSNDNLSEDVISEDDFSQNETSEDEISELEPAVIPTPMKLQQERPMRLIQASP